MWKARCRNTMSCMCEPTETAQSLGDDTDAVVTLPKWHESTGYTYDGPENAVLPVYEMEDVHHDALWRALLNKARQRGACAPNRPVIECDGYRESRLSSTQCTQHVYVRDERERLFIEVSLMEEGKTECASCARTFSRPRCSK